MFTPFGLSRAEEEYSWVTQADNAVTYHLRRELRKDRCVQQVSSGAVPLAVGHRKILRDVILGLHVCGGGSRTL